MGNVSALAGAAGKPRVNVKYFCNNAYNVYDGMAGAEMEDAERTSVLQDCTKVRNAKW